MRLALLIVICAVSAYKALAATAIVPRAMAAAIANGSVEASGAVDAIPVGIVVVARHGNRPSEVVPLRIFNNTACEVIVGSILPSCSCGVALSQLQMKIAPFTSCATLVTIDSATPRNLSISAEWKSQDRHGCLMVPVEVIRPGI